jgi:signal transduction histidine kinase
LLNQFRLKEDRVQENVKQWSTRTVLAGTLILSALPLVVVEMFPTRLRFVMEPSRYIVYHNIAEFFSIMVSLSMFGVGWFTYDQSKNRHALFLGTAFLAIGFMDFMHTLGMVAMPDFITPNLPNKSVQFWVAVRLFQGAAFLASAYVYPERPIRWLSKKVLMTSALLVSVVVFTGITFFPSYMPTTFVAGVGLTPFKKFCEYLVIGLLCAATAAYWRRMERTGDRLLIYYLTAFVICIFSELVFAFYTRMFDTYNVLGHIYKVAAFSLIYYGIFKASVKAPYLRLSETGEKLKGEIAERVRTEEALREAHNTLENRVKERTTELAQSNAQLRTEAEIRQKAEEALRQSHERTAWLARFPEENPNPVARVSINGSVLYCNPAAVKLPGWTCAVGQPLDDRLLPLLNQAMTEGEEAKQDVEFGDRVYSVWVTAFPAEGYANFYGRDMTDRKRAEEVLGQRTLELQHLSEMLEQKVQERTAELERANKTLQELSSKLLSAQEDERKRIAGELHDTIGSCLSGVKYKIENVLQQLGKTANVTEESLSSVIPVIQDGIEECRRMQQDLRPAMLDDLGLLATLSWFCRRYQTIYTGIKVELERALEERDIPHALKIVIYRVMQEGMNNIAKHSKADFVRLSLRKIGRRIQLVLEDNGQGFDLKKVLGSASTKRGLGLTSMKERTELSGGSFSINSDEGKGTVIRASWPLGESS